MSNYDLAYIANSNNFIKNIIYYEKITSTNNAAKELLNNVDTSTSSFLILSDCQTKGRGKGNSRFFSPAGVGIYMSVVLIKPQYDLKLISIATSLAILKSIKHFVDADIKIKWPNDILVNGKKACGILIEASAQPKDINVDYVIIGIGLNVNNDGFDSMIESIATSLKMESSYTIDRNKLIVKILAFLEHLLSKDLKDLFKEYLINLEEKSLNNIAKCSELSRLFILLDR